MSIGVNIGGDRGTIAATVVRDSLDDLIGLLSDASVASGAGRQKWTIDQLEIGSAIMAISAPDESPVAHLLRKGLASLSGQAAIPDGWSRRMVERVRDLGQRVGRGGATEVWIIGVAPEATSLSGQIAANAETALGAATVSVGSVRGIVDRWNEHNGREVKMTLSDGSSATVTYRAPLADRVVREALKNTIDAWGEISRDVSGRVVTVKLEDFEVVPQRQPTPIAALAGIYTDDGAAWFGLDDWMASRGD